MGEKPEIGGGRSERQQAICEIVFERLSTEHPPMTTNSIPRPANTPNRST
jgi:hypothetical protein